ncbi:MAG: hypothetical protein Q8M64_14910, partial [Methyloversatilis sp.]|nr:hypothetical protein [Methyloversatilis sp.]
MQDFPGHLTSKLPDVGTTIFTIISREAQACGAINLAQGFPDFSADPPLFDAVADEIGPVSILINYAGVGGEGRALD